jgi:Na+-transporting NADH:ubiquinone oxidoreductase subunit NqrC
MLQATTKRLKQFKRGKCGKRGISTVIVVMLSLVLIVLIVGNVVLWSYQMNQLDMDRIQETVTMTGVEKHGLSGIQMDIKNTGPVSVHIVAVWISTSTNHQRYDADLFLNAGEPVTYIRDDIEFPNDAFVAKVVTERGNIAVFS